MKNYSVIFLFLLIFSRSESLANSTHLAWVLEKALRVTDYKETNELLPVFTQLADALEEESILSSGQMSVKLLSSAGSLRGFITLLIEGHAPFKEISDLLNRIKIFVSINNIYYLLDDKTGLVRVKEDLEVNISSILSAAKAIKLNLDEETEIQRLLEEIRKIQPDKFINKKSRKIRSDLKIVLDRVLSKV